jgi:hypothetical protein
MTSPGEEVRPRPTLPPIRDLFRGEYGLRTIFIRFTDTDAIRRAELAQSTTFHSTGLDSPCFGLDLFAVPRLFATPIG